MTTDLRIAPRQRMSGAIPLRRIFICFYGMDGDNSYHVHILITVWKYVAALHPLFLQTLSINFPRRRMKVRDCVLFTDINGQLYLCRVIYSAAYFVVGLIPGGRSFTATITREQGSGQQRQNVGEMSFHKVCQTLTPALCETYSKVYC